MCLEDGVSDRTWYTVAIILTLETNVYVKPSCKCDGTLVRKLIAGSAGRICDSDVATGLK